MLSTSNANKQRVGDRNLSRNKGESRRLASKSNMPLLGIGLCMAGLAMLASSNTTSTPGPELMDSPECDLPIPVCTATYRPLPFDIPAMLEFEIAAMGNEGVPHDAALQELLKWPWSHYSPSDRETVLAYVRAMLANDSGKPLQFAL